MQTAISKSRRFSCLKFTGDVEALKTAVPKIDLFTCENVHKTEVWVASNRQRPDNGLDCLRWQLHPGDWIFIDRDEESGYRLVRARTFEDQYSIDPNPNYQYTSDLRVWHNGYEWVVAETPEAAIDILIAGGCDYCRDEDNEWTALPAGKCLTTNDETLGPCTMLACAWAERGAGFLGSTEY
jgi:hypothetical protein